jgi:hypothetical protein
LPQSRLENNRDYNFDLILDRKTNLFKMILITNIKISFLRIFFSIILVSPSKVKFFLHFPSCLLSFWILHKFSERNLRYCQISPRTLLYLRQPKQTFCFFIDVYQNFNFDHFFTVIRSVNYRKRNYLVAKMLLLFKNHLTNFQCIRLR